MTPCVPCRTVESYLLPFDRPTTQKPVQAVHVFRMVERSPMPFDRPEA
jgi:hypothetical protein